MAVTLTVPQLAVALRLATAPDQTIPAAQTDELTRILATATAMVERYAPAAPDGQHNEAAIRLAGWLYDTDPSEIRRVQSPMANSGAAALLAPWRVQRATAAPESDTTTPTTPSTSGGPGVDAVARAAAATAQSTANANAAKLMPVSNAEADAGVATTIRGWTAAAVRRVVEAIVHPWARAANPPAPAPITDGDIPATIARDSEVTAAVEAERQARNQAILDTTTAEVTARNNAIAAAVVPNADRARIPVVALPAPTMATRGHALAQALDGETMVFRQGGEANDGTARTTATNALNKANANADLIAAGLSDPLARRLIGLLQSQARQLHATHGDPALVTNTDDVSIVYSTLPLPPGGTSAGVATLTEPDNGWPSNRRITIRLADSLPRAGYLIRFHGDSEPIYDVSGGTWTEDTDVNESGFTYWAAWPQAIGDLVTRVELLTDLGDTVYTGELADGIVTEDSLATALDSKLLRRWTEQASKLFSDTLNIEPQPDLALTTGLPTVDDWILVEYVGWRMNGKGDAHSGVAIYNLHSVRAAGVSILGYTVENARRGTSQSDLMPSASPAAFRIARNIVTNAEAAEVYALNSGAVDFLPVGASIKVTKIRTTTAIERDLLSLILSGHADQVPETLPDTGGGGGIGEFTMVASGHGTTRANLVAWSVTSGQLDLTGKRLAYVRFTTGSPAPTSVGTGGSTSQIFSLPALNVYFMRDHTSAIRASVPITGTAALVIYFTPLAGATNFAWEIWAA